MPSVVANLDLSGELRERLLLVYMSSAVVVMPTSVANLGLRGELRGFYWCTSSLTVIAVPSVVAILLANSSAFPVFFKGCSPQSKREVKSVENNASSVGSLLGLTGSSAQSHLDLLQRLTSESSLATAGSRKTIAEQLKEDLELEGGEEVTIPLGSGKLDIQATDLTISQKRNIARQKYLDKVSPCNDAPFFTAVALFVLVPPIAILGVAVATGYVDLFP